MQYDKLKRDTSFAQLRKKGSSFVAPAFIILATNTQSDEKIKIGITASKKIGNAVIRAKARRRIRAGLNLTNPELFEKLSGFELNIICRTQSLTVEMPKLEFYLNKTLENVCKKYKKN